MKETKEVSNFSYTYRILDRRSNRFYGDYSSIKDIIDIIRKIIGNKRLITPKIFSTKLNRIIELYSKSDLPNIYYNDGRFTVIEIESGRILETCDVWSITFKKNYPYTQVYKRYYNNINKRSRNMIKIKGDGRKIKNHFAAKKCYNQQVDNKYYYSNGRYLSNYSNLPHKCDYRFSKTVDLDNIEFSKGKFIRGKRRFSAGLWKYERRNGAWDGIKSWKHHSKRRKQWIPN